MRPFRTKIVPLPYKCSASTWQPQSFFHCYYKHQKPVKFGVKEFGHENSVPALKSWVKPYRQSVHKPFLGPYQLEHDYLERFGDAIVPIERTTWNADSEKSWGVKSFERIEAPLSFFLEWTKHKLANPSTFCPNESLYIAQCPIGCLPKELRDDLPAPLLAVATDAVSKNEVGKIRSNFSGNSSIWLGIPPTETPLHKDPESNFLVQIAGFKSVRLMMPDDGAFMLANAKKSIAIQLHEKGPLGAFNMNMRGEEMMAGPERELMRDLVWGEAAGALDKVANASEEILVNEIVGTGEEKSSSVVPMNDQFWTQGIRETGPDHDEVKIYETFLRPGEALHIPKGWYHSVRGLGSHATGINVSANWWFDHKKSPYQKRRYSERGVDSRE